MDLRVGVARRKNGRSCWSIGGRRAILSREEQVFSTTRLESYFEASVSLRVGTVICRKCWSRCQFGCCKKSDTAAPSASPPVGPACYVCVYKLCCPSIHHPSRLAVPKRPPARASDCAPFRPHPPVLALHRPRAQTADLGSRGLKSGSPTRQQLLSKRKRKRKHHHRSPSARRSLGVGAYLAGTLSSTEPARRRARDRLQAGASLQRAVLHSRPDRVSHRRRTTLRPAPGATLP